MAYKVEKPKQRTQTEIRRIIDEAFIDRVDIDAKEKWWHEVEDGTFDYASVMPAVLGPPVIAKRRTLTQKVALLESVLGWPYRIMIDLGDDRPTAKAQEDLLEVFFRETERMADPNGSQMEAARNHIVTSRYGAVWVTVIPRETMTQGEHESKEVYDKRCQAYEASYSRYHMEAINPAVCGEVTRGGRMQLAVIEEKVPIINCLQPWSEDEQELKPHQILTMRWPNGVKSSDGVPIDEHTLHSSYVTRIVIDDGEWIQTYIDIGVQQHNRSRYHAEPEPFRNTFGRPSLLLAYGTNRPHRQKKTKYEALIAPHVEVEYRLTLMESIALTVAANPRFVNEVPPEVSKDINRLISEGIDPKLLQQDLTEEVTTRDGRRRRRVPAIRGTMKDVSTKLGDEFMLVYNGLLRQEEKAEAALMMLNPSPDVIEKGTAASIFAGIEASMRTLEKPVKSLEVLRKTFFEMVAHDVVYGLNPHLMVSGASKQHDVPVKFRVRKGAAKVKAGDRSIDPDVFTNFPKPGEISTEIIPGGETQKAARVQMAMSLVDAGYESPDAVFEARGIQNVTQKLIEVAASNNAAMLGPGNAKLAYIDMLRFIALREGRDPELLLQTYLPELVPPEARSLSSLTGGTTYNPPATPTPQV